MRGYGASHVDGAPQPKDNAMKLPVSSFIRMDEGVDLKKERNTRTRGWIAK
jgi:hypothetical protein